MQNPLKAIVFDFDGVIAESVDVKTQAFAALYAHEGQEVVEQVVQWHLQHGGISRFEKFRHYQEVVLMRPPLSPLQEQELSDRFSHLVVEEVVNAAWVNGALEALTHLGKTLPLFIASGTPEDELLDIVRRRGIEDRFVSIHGSPARKGEILKALSARHGYDPAQMLMIGDALTDLDGAAAAGTCFLGRVPQGHRNPFPANIPVISDLSPLATCSLEALPGALVLAAD